MAFTVRPLGGSSSYLLPTVLSSVRGEHKHICIDETRKHTHIRLQSNDIESRLGNILMASLIACEFGRVGERWHRRGLSIAFEMKDSSWIFVK